LFLINEYNNFFGVMANPTVLNNNSGLKVHDVLYTIVSRLPLAEALQARTWSQSWRHAVDEALKEMWNKIERHCAQNVFSSPTLTDMISRVEQQVPVPQGEDKPACVLFGKLNALFRDIYQLPFDRSQSLDSLFLQAQQRQQWIQNQALCAMWEHALYFPFRKEPACPPRNASVDDIRTWMKDNPNTLSRVTVLEVQHMKMLVIPPEIGLLTQLKQLCLSGSPITIIPHSIASCTELRELSLSSTHITTLPPALASLSKLRILHIANLSFYILPVQLQKLLLQLQTCSIPESAGRMVIPREILQDMKDPGHSLHHLLKEFQQYISYPVKSSLSKVYQSLMTADLLQAQTSFDTLSPQMQQNIYTHYFGQNRLEEPPLTSAQLTDPYHFLDAVKKTIANSVEQLTPPERKTIQSLFQTTDLRQFIEHCQPAFTLKKTELYFSGEFIVMAELLKELGY
jgi:Leucine-rich repeat (LRR) protein